MYALCALLALLALAGCGGSSSHSSTVKLTPPRHDFESIIEEKYLMGINPKLTIAQYKSLGASRARLSVHWNVVAPDPNSRREPSFDSGDPAAYPAAGWAGYDKVVRALAKAGMPIDMTVGGGVPLWAETDAGSEPKTHPPGVWRPSAQEFGRFMHAIATRYSGHYTPPGASKPLPRVSFWSIWNEPNYGQELAPQAISPTGKKVPSADKVEVAPTLYRQLVDAAWTALHATGHGGDTFLFGELAPRGLTTGSHPGNFDGMVPLRFLRAMYCLGAGDAPLSGSAATARGCPATAAARQQFPARNPALFNATGFADHMYPQGGAAPNVRTPDEPDYADLASVPRLEATLDAATKAYGSQKRFDIWNTEFGYQTDPPEPGLPNPTLAAMYLNWSEYISYTDPRIRSFDQYLIIDPPGSSTSSFDTGLEQADGVHKATYEAWQMPIFLPQTSTSKGDPLLVWGAARPAAWTAGAQRVQIQFRSGGAFKTVKTVALSRADRDYFETRVPVTQSGTLRLAWQQPGTGELYSRNVAVTVK